MKKYPFYILMLLITITLISCTQRTSKNQSDNSGDDILPVMVSIVPQKYFLEHIGGDKVDITVLIPPGSSPHSFEPKPDDLKRISKVKAYFTIGIEFEKAWMDKIKSVNENMKIFRTEEGVKFNNVIEAKTDKPGIDTHIWISPSLVKIQSENIYNGLSEIDPDNEPYYKENLLRFLAEIDELDSYIKDSLSNLDNRKFMIFHPSWGYFAEEYDLEMIPIEIEGKEPSAQELAALIDTARENKIKIIFVSPSFSTKTAEVIADEIGGDVLFISVLEPDWKANLKKVADIFSKVMKENKQ